MRILFVSAYFPPEIGAPAVRVYELARRWARRGHSVEVLTGFPNHPTGIIPSAYRSKMRRLFMRETLEGIQVSRCWLYPAPNRRAWERILNYSSFGFSAGCIGPWLRRPDLVMATSPHLLVGWVGWWLSFLFHAPFLLEIRDLWPESLLASGVGRQNSWMIRALDRLADFLYRRADRIVTVTEAMAARLEQHRNIPRSRLAVIEHGVDGERFRPAPASNWPEEAAQLNGHPVVAYIGTLGMAQGLETLLRAAEQVAGEEPQVQFLLVGEGADKERLTAWAGARVLRNVHFLGQQPHEEMPMLINRATLCVALHKAAETFEVTLPSKILEYWACGKPVVLSARGHPRRVLEASGGGIGVEPEDSSALAEGILRLIRDEGFRRRCGEQGRLYVLKRFDLETQAGEYLRLLQELVK